MANALHLSRHDVVMPPITIPKEHSGWFMWTLLALAGLVVAGVGYSFWRIARVPTPTLDVSGNNAAPAAERGAPQAPASAR
jgi:hypothetical protein